jgi:hypothetical protein
MFFKNVVDDFLQDTKQIYYREGTRLQESLSIQHWDDQVSLLKYKFTSNNKKEGVL